MRWYPDRIPDWITTLFTGYTWHADRSEKKVYLTFDDGPTPDVTTYVLDLLAAFDYKATFFLIGDKAQRYAELRDQLISNGHSIGNHTFNHLNAWKTPYKDYLDNVASAKANTSNNLFRPPYGKITPAITRALKKQGYRIIMWDVLSGDFDLERSETSCLKSLKRNTRNGSIVVFHDSDKSFPKLKKILPEYFKWLQHHGFKTAAL